MYAAAPPATTKKSTRIGVTVFLVPVTLRFAADSFLEDSRSKLME
jgi:hypothetical protein